MAEARRTELRAALVDAAEQVIAERGLPGLRARDLAASVGCALGTIYTVFEDIDALVLEVNLRTLGVFEAVIAASDSSLSSPESLPASGTPPPPHAEVAGGTRVFPSSALLDGASRASPTSAAGPRSTRDRGASFEAPLRGAPQDEEVGSPEPDKEGREGATAELVRLGTAYLDFASAHPARWRALFQHRMADGRAPPEWFIAQQARLFRLVEAPLGALCPGLSDDDRALLARTLFSATHGVVSLGLDEKLAALPPGVVRAQLETLIRAMAAGLAERGRGAWKRTPTLDNGR